MRPETTQVFPDHPGRHAGVLNTAPGTSPVVLEAVYEPGPSVWYFDQRYHVRGRLQCSPFPNSFGKKS